MIITMIIKLFLLWNPRPPFFSLLITPPPLTSLFPLGFGFGIDYFNDLTLPNDILICFIQFVRTGIGS